VYITYIRVTFCLGIFLKYKINYEKETEFKKDIEEYTNECRNILSDKFLKEMTDKDKYTECTKNDKKNNN
jgi:hypothetical protein